MSESNKSKFAWVLIGAVIGGFASLSFEYWIKPYFEPKPKISVSAASNSQGEAEFYITNIGNAPATDVRVTLWAASTFNPRNDIIDIEHLGGASDAECEPAIKIEKLYGGGSRPNQLNTKSSAGFVDCQRINPGEKWHGRVLYNIPAGSGGVPGLLALVKEREASENLHARFEDGL